MIKLKDNSYLFSIILLLSSFFFIRLFLWNWASLDLSFDEAQYFSWAQNLDWGYYSKPPMLAWIIKIFTALCGDSELCIRIASPFLHSFTALFIGLASYNFASYKNKFIILMAASIWLLIPGISLSSGFISTDVPLLFFTSLCLWILSLFSSENMNYKNNIYFLLLGVFLALAFLSKYAILYLLIGSIVAVVMDRDIRNNFFIYINFKRLCLILIFFFIIIIPHILWNFENGFITAQHTMANANLGGEWKGISNLIKFFVEQFFVYGFITFLILLVILFKFKTFNRNERFLIFLTLTPILIILFQAFISRAHANWAAIAYVPGTILVTTYFMQLWDKNKKHLFYINVISGLFIMFLIPLSGVYNLGVDPYKKNRGWSELGLAISEIFYIYPDAVLVADDRRVLAEALYYMKIKPYNWVRWNADGIIHDHYELVTDHNDLISKTGIMVSSEEDNIHFKSFFKDVIFIKTITRKMGNDKIKEYKVWMLKGYIK